jgi:hypothetical protein
MQGSESSRSSVRSVSGTRLACCAGVVTLALGLGGVLVPGAQAQGETLHFFQKSVTNDFFNAAGRPIDLNPPATVPGKGDRLDSTDLDYVGTAAHHTAKWAGSDHVSCTFVASAKAICDAELAVGRSLVLATDDTVQFGPGPVTLRVTGGTGIFAGAHGTLTSVNTSAGNDANLTVKLG